MAGGSVTGINKAMGIGHGEQSINEERREEAEQEQGIGRISRIVRITDAENDIECSIQDKDLAA